MRELKKIKISHTGEQQGSLYLSDIDDAEENNDPSDKVQVYVPENGSIELPLNNRVMQSYNQGSIRGFMEAGLIRTSFVNSSSVSDPIYEEIQYSADRKPSKVIEWESSQKESKLRESQYTYDSRGRISEEVEIQYASDGSEARMVLISEKEKHVFSQT